MQSTTFTCPGGTGEKCYPDHDADGHPGITVKLKQDGVVPKQLYDCIAPWEYMTAPLSTLGALDKGAGADETYIGLRTKIGGSGKIAAGCMSGGGSADADGFDTRLFGCKLKSSGMPCDDTGAAFVDLNLPNFHVLQATQVPPPEWKHPRAEADAVLNRAPSAGPKSSVVRLGDLGANVTCAQVRSTMYP
jgi:hypothetical protein